MLNSLEMDQSNSESDVSLSPSRILERLQELRQIQLLQRGKLQKQRSQYENSPETSSSVTEIISHFSNSTSYNTFRNLLQSSQETSNEGTPRLNTSNLSQKVQEQDLIEGVSLLNLSQESELIINSPTSFKSTVLPTFKSENDNSPVNKKSEPKLLIKKQISLDEMPILTPKQNFETLVIEKLQSEKNTNKNKNSKEIIKHIPNKKPFLKKGEGMSRFGIKKNDFVIQSTKSLPWKSRSTEKKHNNSPLNKKAVKPFKNTKVPIQILVNESKPTTIKCVVSKDKITDLVEKSITLEKPKISPQKNNDKEISSIVDSSDSKVEYTSISTQKIENLKGKHPLLTNKGKTWAAVLTKEQDDFLRQLKQSDYYKNFASPAKSTVSDISCDENLLKLRQDRETAEQNMFELLEKKVTQENFNLESSFFNRFLKVNKLECSGESTPLIMQKCLANNPSLMHIFPDLTHRKKNEDTYTDSETCDSEHTECCSDACSSVSTNCSCKTVEETNNSTENYKQDNIHKKKETGHNTKINKANTKEVEKLPENEKSQNDIDINNDTMKANMVEMNAKLIATSELLKERLHELEDEIETFREENANLSKMREEVDLERQKFYEEKTAFEQKFNEEKILSEYYLAEEKEKLNKQKAMYERYVRELRGRLNKKDKDEVINLKKEVNDLKEEIRLKDAKSTSTIARLRNQIKIMEKEKKVMQDEVEKLKKENRRIQHSNDMTRRLTNLKYLEEINKKLAHMTNQDNQPGVCMDSDMKYRTFEIEKQSKNRKVQPVAKNISRPRAKSVPNLNVTSKYAKYFSQRDAISQMEKNKSLNVEHLDTYTYPSDNDDTDDNENNINSDDTDFIQDRMTNNEDENNLEKMYRERFQSNSPKSNRSSLTNSTTSHNSEKRDIDTADNFFIRKSNSNTTFRNSKSPTHVPTSAYLKSAASNRSSITGLSNGSSSHKSINNSKDQYKSSEYMSNISEGPNISNRSKSPVSILSNRSSSSQRFNTVIYQEPNTEEHMLVSPEPSTSKTSLTKTNLNPTEIKKSDGSRELRFPNGNVKYISPNGKYSKFLYYNGDVKENFYDEGRIKYFYAETKTFHTTHADGLEVLEFPDGQIEKRYKDGSSEIRLPNGSIRYFDPKNEHVREEWRFPDGAALTVSADGEQRIVFSNGQVEVHAKDHKRREFPDGTVKLVYNDGTSETRYALGRVRIKDKHGNLIMDSAPG